LIRQNFCQSTRGNAAARKSNKKLKDENIKWRVLDTAKQKQVDNLQEKLEKKSSEYSGSEIGKLWQGVGQLKISDSASSGSHQSADSIASPPISVHRNSGDDLIKYMYRASDTTWAECDCMTIKYCDFSICFFVK